MVKIELDSQRPTSGEVNEYGEVVLNFIDLDGVYIPDDVAGQHNVVIKKMTVVADDITLPQNEGYIQKKENLSDGYTFGELTLSREDLDELINTTNPVKALYEKNPEIMKEPLVNYYNEYLKEDDFDDFEDIYGTDEDDELERLANTYGRDSDEFIDAESKKDLMDDAKSEQEKTAAVAAAINDEDLNSQVLSQLTNNEDVYIGDDVIIEAPFEDEEEIGTITDEGLDFIAKTYSFDLIKDEDGSWGIYDTATPDQALSSSIEEVKDIEIVGIEEQFEDGFGSEYAETYSEEDFNFEESKDNLFQKINRNAKAIKESSYISEITPDVKDYLKAKDTIAQIEKRYEIQRREYENNQLFRGPEFDNTENIKPTKPSEDPEYIAAEQIVNNFHNKQATFTEAQIQIGDDKDKAYGEGYKAAKADQYKSMRTSNPYEVGTDTYRYWDRGYKAGEEDLRCGWYNESKKRSHKDLDKLCEDILNFNKLYEDFLASKEEEQGSEYKNGYDDYMSWSSKLHGEEPFNFDKSKEYLRGWYAAKEERSEQIRKFIADFRSTRESKMKKGNGVKLQESDESWFEEIYERERDGDYETPAECCNCGADCHDGGEIINSDVYCHDCAERERDK